MRLPKNLIGSEYIKNISIQLVGTGVSQLIPLLLSPVLTRLYPQTGFATLTIFMAVVGILVVPAGGRYYYAIVIPKENSEAAHLGRVSLWITMLYGLFLGLLSLLFFDFLNNYYPLEWIWYIIPIYVIFYGIYNIVLYQSVRKKHFRINAIAKIGQSFGNTFFSLVLGLFGLIFSGLVLGKFVGLLLSIPLFRFKLNFKPDLLLFKKIALKYIDYPKYTILPALLDVFSLQALVFFVGKFYSQQTLGYLGLTNMILVAPLALIGVSFRDVFYQRIASYYYNKEYLKARKLFFGSALALFSIGAVIAFVLFFLGGPIFSILFGDNWKISGDFAMVLGFSLWIKLCVSPLSSIFNASSQLKMLSGWQILYFLTTTITLYTTIAYFKVTIYSTLIVYSIHEVVLYSLYFILQTKALKKFKYQV